jgi:hypothetical protein
VVSQDLLAALPSGLDLKDDLHTDWHPENAWPAATLIRDERDATAHGASLSASAEQVWIRLRQLAERLPPLGRRATDTPQQTIARQIAVIMLSA